MKDILIGVVVFAIIFGGALLGMFLGKILPVQHLSTESRDVIRIVMGMLAMLSSVTLGFSPAPPLARSPRGRVNCAVRACNSSCGSDLGRVRTETAPTRALLKQVLSERISQIWPEEGGAVSLSALSGGPGINLVQRDLFALSPQTERQRWLRSNALEITNTIAESRWTTVEQIGSRFPWAFFIVVVFWLAVVFASFGLFAPRNASVIAALFVAALALAAPIFMMFETDQPYGGLVKIPSTSLRIALDQLGRS